MRNPSLISLLAIAILAAAVVLAQGRSVHDGVYSERQATRGKAHYERFCLDCHGDQLEGDPVQYPELAGGNFRDKWNGLNLADLYQRIHRDMPPTKPGSLSAETSADLIAYILSANQFPAGAQDLPHDPHILKEIRIEAR